MKRIVLTGAESTGKSTLAKALAKQYGAPVSHEFVRSYVDQLDRELNIDDLQTIASGQLACEQEAVSQASTIVFHDTNILSSIIYAAHYFDQSIATADQALDAAPYTHYLLCETDIPWEADDGQRESPETRDHLQDIFRTQLKQRMLPYTTISGTLDERIRQATQVIDALG